jgi:hypothetical protein
MENVTHKKYGSREGDKNISLMIGRPIQWGKDQETRGSEMQDSDKNHFEGERRRRAISG